HIRGQHAEYTYYIDGVPVPSSIGGTLNELFDPAIIDRIGFQTGGWDAEFGNRNIAVINVTTRIPPGGAHWQLSSYDGSFHSDGQTVLASEAVGPLGFLLSVTRQETSMRREPLQAAANGVPMNFHNAGQDQYGFGKAEWRPSARDVVTLDLNASRTHAAIPYDSSFGVLDDHQTDQNGFANLGWRHRFASISGAASGAPASNRVTELFSAIYLRRSGLDYVPGSVDDPQFIFYPDTADRFNVQEHRLATTIGTKADFEMPAGRSMQWKSGVDVSYVRGREDFNTLDAGGAAGPSVNTNVAGGDAGAYSQLAWDISSHWQLRTGVRLDDHVAPVAGDAHQVSPRVRLNWFPRASTSAWLYYGRLFIPSNVEDFHVLAAAAQGDTVGLPTVPERDQYFEAGVVQQMGSAVTAKLAGYYRNNSPAIDDNTLPGTALVATVNVGTVHVTGIESVLEFHPDGPLTGYINSALSHASAHGPVTGGFFPTPYPTGWFDQDHDQRLSIVASANYSPGRSYVNLTANFGSGLSNGDPGAAPNETGLFDFNPRVKVAPSLVISAGAGTRRTFDGTVIRLDLSVDNLLNHHYILKGAFTSGPSVGRPRSVSLRCTLSR
ncbi:MAG: TonB-dependent receptor plug domain-containing protein, partial [Gemmatimonadaceae bacterium]